MRNSSRHSFAYSSEFYETKIERAVAFRSAVQKISALTGVYVIPVQSAMGCTLFAHNAFLQPIDSNRINLKKARKKLFRRCGTVFKGCFCSFFCPSDADFLKRVEMRSEPCSGFGTPGNSGNFADGFNACSVSPASLPPRSRECRGVSASDNPTQWAPCPEGVMPSSGMSALSSAAAPEAPLTVVLTERQRSHLKFAASCQIDTLLESDESEDPEVREAIDALESALKLLKRGLK